VLVMASIVVLTSLVAPLAATVADAGRARQAAEFLAARLRLTRQQAVSRSASVGLVFDVIDGHQAFRVCTDGNENGIRRADIQAGTDPCVEGPYDIAALFAGVQVAVDGSLKGPDGEAGSPDPVRFGRGEIASFSPLGTCTAGSIFLRSRQGLQYAVRLAGVTGRVRILWYDASTRVWREV
jgi:hypothetical protein